MQANRTARWVNIVLGVWLFISAFIWAHAPDQFTNTWICGGAIAIFGIVAMSVPQARYANAAIAVWLFVSAWALGVVSIGTFWNNLLVSIAVFVAALIPTAGSRRTVGPHAEPRGPHTDTREPVSASGPH